MGTALCRFSERSVVALVPGVCEGDEPEPGLEIEEPPGSFELGEVAEPTSTAATTTPPEESEDDSELVALLYGVPALCPYIAIPRSPLILL